MNKHDIEEELKALREIYPLAGAEDQEKMKARGLEIKKIIQDTRWCAWCKNKPAGAVNEYYCSQECQDLYYPPKKSVSEKVKARLGEIAKISVNK